MSWLDDIAEGFAEGFVPAYNKRMDRQAVEDQSILEARIRGTQDTAKARREQEARDRQRLKMANGIVGATGIGDVGLAYGLLETYGDDPKTVTEMIRSNPITSLQPTAASQPAPTPAASTVSAPSDPATFEEAKPGIFAGESGGDYNALFNFTNREGKEFSNVRLTEMTVDQALEFANPSGDYAGYVRGQVGRTATPMGAYQVVGTTLRAAKEGLGLTGDEVMTPETQDMIGKWIFDNQGVGAWVGYKAGNVPADATQDQMVAAGLADPTVREPAPAEPEAASSDNLFMTALGFNQAERDRQIDTRFNQFADATGLNSDTGGFATPQSSFRLNMGPERADLPKISEVRASNYQALAAAAEQGGNPELAANITSLGEEMSSATPERQAVIQDAIENVGSSLSVINTRIGETQGTVNGFIGATDSAYNLINILKDQPDILTFFGGRVPSFISSVDNEVSALSTLLAETTSTDAADARVSNFESQIDARISEGTIDARAAAYAKYAAQEVRMAYMIVRSQQPTGPISQADFESAFQQVRTSSRSSTVEDSLRGIISADRINVTSMQDTLRNDPQVYGANRILKEANITDFDPLGGLLQPIEEIAEARGAGDAMRWLSGETNLIERQDAATPTEEQNTAQTTTPETVIEQARAAIARGADADAVRQRLIDNGYDASGL